MPSLHSCEGCGDADRCKNPDQIKTPEGLTLEERVKYIVFHCPRNRAELEKLINEKNKKV